MGANQPFCGVRDRTGALGGRVGTRVSHPGNGCSQKVQQGALQPGVEEAGRAGPQCPWAPV